MELVEGPNSPVGFIVRQASDGSSEWTGKGTADWKLTRGTLKETPQLSGAVTTAVSAGTITATAISKRQ